MRQDFEKVLNVLEVCEPIGKEMMVPKAEFQRRQSAVWSKLDTAGIDIGFVFSDDHYNIECPTWVATPTSLSNR